MIEMFRKRWFGSRVSGDTVWLRGGRARPLRALPSIGGRYHVSTDNGLFLVENGAVWQLHDLPVYGIAREGGHFWCAAFHRPGKQSIVFRVPDKDLEPGRHLTADVLYRIGARSSNVRLHQAGAGVGRVHFANTRRNCILTIDSADPRRQVETFPFLDTFGDPILEDHNHINSVTDAGDCLLFVAFRAGGGSIIGVIRDGEVTGFRYRTAGVHDIYLRGNDFWFSDTFGPALDGVLDGGAPVTRDGVFSPDAFAGRQVIRAAAEQDGEIIVGHSFRGSREERGKGRGALIVFRDGAPVGREEFVASQVYQILRADGGNFDSPLHGRCDDILAMFRDALGEPVHRCRARIKEVTPG